MTKISKSLPSALAPNEGALLQRVKIAQKLSFFANHFVALHCNGGFKSVCGEVVVMEIKHIIGDVMHRNKKVQFFYLGQNGQNAPKSYGH